MFACLKAKKHESDETFLTKNGGVLLEEVIAFSNGRSNPIRHFSAEELLRATNYYDERQVILENFDYKMYKGSLKDRLIIVKRYEHDVYPRARREYPNPYKNIAMGSQMSAHKNVLKVLGCCLETKNPIIVYEFGGTKCLSTCISATNVEPLPWKCRLKIAMELANAFAYLHSAFSRPVIHRDIQTKNVILDENNIPKLIDLGLCISIPEGESCVKDVLLGTAGNSAPECYETGYVTEKADVYGFGILLFELSIGEKIFPLLAKRGKNVPFNEMLGNIFRCISTNEVTEQEQLMDFNTLLLRCTSFDEEQRPTMIEVAKELRQIYQSIQSPRWPSSIWLHYLSVA